MKRIALLAAMMWVSSPNAVAQPKDGPAANPVAHGIPAEIAHRLGIAKDVERQVEDAAFDANRTLIDLEATHKKAQLDLDKELRAASPDEGKVMQFITAASQAELAVRKNRLGLLLKVRKLLGPEMWERVQLEMSTLPARPPVPPAPPVPPTPPKH